MALVISAVQVTGTATAYTVPAGKIAKVRVVNIDSFGGTMNRSIRIGNYESFNSNLGGVQSRRQSFSDATPNSLALPQIGFVFACSTADSLSAYGLYIKEDHVLVAGETVSCDDAGCTMSYTIFEEDA